MKNLWVSADGSWGVNEVKKFDTTNWQDKDWDRLDEECDSLKLSFAKYITRKRNKQAKKKLISELQSMDIRTFIIGEDGSVTEDNGGDVRCNPPCEYC
jgi:hypothetical protein